MATCKRPGCISRAEARSKSVFQLCEDHVDVLSVYVNRKPVWGSPGVTTVSPIRYRGARRRFGWAQ
jgi:hypothetical protein